jgi:hypothetical protein
VVDAQSGAAVGVSEGAEEVEGGQVCWLSPTSAGRRGWRSKALLMQTAQKLENLTLWAVYLGG